MTTLEGNKFIAEFMGDFELVKEFQPEFDVTYMWKKISNKCFGYDTTDWIDHSTNTVYSDRVCYNFKWDWLMPCVGKISNQCEEPEELDSLKYALFTNNIEEAWKFVVNYLTTF